MAPGLCSGGAVPDTQPSPQAGPCICTRSAAAAAVIPSWGRSRRSVVALDGGTPDIPDAGRYCLAHVTRLPEDTKRLSSLSTMRVEFIGGGIPVNLKVNVAINATNHVRPSDLFRSLSSTALLILLPPIIPWFSDCTAWTRCIIYHVCVRMRDRESDR
jgi:hypothetical protein